jgi:hypothetical protein
VNNLRLWIAILALSAFGAGLAAGILVGPRLRPSTAEAGPFEHYQRRFAERFELSPERERLLAELLANYHREIQSLQEERLARSMSELEPELSELGLTYRERIRNSVLPPDRRPEYDRLAAGSDWTPPH